MGKTSTRLDIARRAYRQALEAARASPTPEAWAKLLAAGKELSDVQEPRSRGRRSRRGATPTISDLEGEGERPARELEIELE